MLLRQAAGLVRRHSVLAGVALGPVLVVVVTLAGVVGLAPPAAPREAGVPIVPSADPVDCPVYPAGWDAPNLERLIDAPAECAE